MINGMYHCYRAAVANGKVTGTHSVLCTCVCPERDPPLTDLFQPAQAYQIDCPGCNISISQYTSMCDCVIGRWCSANKGRPRQPSNFFFAVR